MSMIVDVVESFGGERRQELSTINEISYPKVSDDVGGKYINSTCVLTTVIVMVAMISTAQGKASSALAASSFRAEVASSG